MEAAGGAILLCDKPAGITSHDMVVRVRRERGCKAGHAGTLDPFATGLLLVLLGRATRLQRFLVGLPKTYIATARLGWRSSTGDPDGELTETGRVRHTNEDSYLMRGVLFMVADGMGGAAAGELASAICTEAFAEIDLIRSGGDAALRDAIKVANRRIFDRAASDPEVAGMGTTVTAALFGDDDRVVLANVGDSRAYLLRDGKLQRLSQDHSVVAELVASGQISEDEAERHPQRSVITRVLGAEAGVQIDIFWLDAKEGDLLMLCSDGLTTMVPESRIADG